MNRRSDTKPGKVAQVELLGTGENVSWQQRADALRVELPKEYRPKTNYAAALKISFS